MLLAAGYKNNKISIRNLSKHKRYYKTTYYKLIAIKKAFFKAVQDAIYKKITLYYYNLNFMLFI